MTSNIEMLVERAKNGDREALSELIGRIQDRIYGLAIRMLGDPADAEDATQEIVVKIATHLGDFREQSAFLSWIFKIASNHLLTTRKRKAERQAYSLEQSEAFIDQCLAPEVKCSSLNPEQKLFAEEIRLSCLHGILLGLDRDLRIAYILGEAFDVSSEQGGYVLGITAAAYRKRLSRARERLHHFMSRNCGVVNKKNRCHCDRWIAYLNQKGVADSEISENGERYKTNHAPEDGILDRLQELEGFEQLTSVFRSYLDYRAPAGLFDELLESLKLDRTTEQ